MGEPGEKKSKVSIHPMKSQQSHTRSMMNMRSMSRLKVRRMSFGFGGVPGIRPIERTSQLAIEFKRPPLIYFPTYQLEPHAPLHLPSIRKTADEMLDELFTGHRYSAQESPTLALRIAGELMRKIKAMQFNRYRIITVVTIGQKRAQSYNNAISFLWDFERDNYVDCQREETTAFIQNQLPSWVYSPISQSSPPPLMMDLPTRDIGDDTLDINLNQGKRLSSGVKVTSHGKKLIRIEIYDADQFAGLQNSFCQCNAEVCIQHVVRNVHTDSIYLSVKEILKSVNQNIHTSLQ